MVVVAVIWILVVVDPYCVWRCWTTHWWSHRVWWSGYRVDNVHCLFRISSWLICGRIFNICTSLCVSIDATCTKDICIYNFYSSFGIVCYWYHVWLHNLRASIWWFDGYPFTALGAIALYPLLAIQEGLLVVRVDLWNIIQFKSKLVHKSSNNSSSRTTSHNCDRTRWFDHYTWQGRSPPHRSNNTCSNTRPIIMITLKI